MCSEIGIRCETFTFPDDVSEEELIQAIQNLNNSKDFHGTMIEMPLPSHLKASTERIINSISPEKDVDGLTNDNLDKLQNSMTPHHVACTPAACLHILKQNGIKVKENQCLIVNQSRVVGLPLASLLMKEGAKLSSCTGYDPNLQEYVKKADIILTAIGCPDIIKSEWIKPGAIVIDIGINVIESEGQQRVVGDIDFHDVAPKAQLITPVPGGVGPLTVMMLMKNVINGWARMTNNKILEDEIIAWNPQSIKSI